MCISKQGENPFYHRNRIMSEDKKLKAYELAIQARKDLKTDYNIWMNFFYIFNGALLVAITSDKIVENNNSKIYISLIGIIVSIFWHLSCRGYRYWIDSWTRIVIKKEKDFFGNVEVFGILAEETKESNSYLGSNNISTSKLMQIISIMIIMGWSSYLFIIFYKEYKPWIIISISILWILYLSIILEIASDISIHRKVSTKIVE